MKIYFLQLKAQLNKKKQFILIWTVDVLQCNPRYVTLTYPSRLLNLKAFCRLHSRDAKRQILDEEARMHEFLPQLPLEFPLSPLALGYCCGGE